MAINPFWSNPFGANVASAGVNPTTGLMADPAPTGGGFFGAINADPVKRDALQAFAAQLLMGGGSSPVRQTGSEVFGRALLASQQARAQAQDQIQKKKLQDAQIAAANAKQSPFGNVDPAKYTPDSIAKFQASGNYGDLQADPAALAGQTPADIATYQYWSKLSPQEQQNFLKLKRNIGSDYQIEIINGVPTLIYKPGAGGMSGPLGAMPGAPPAAGILPGAAAAPTGAPSFMTPLTTVDKQAAGAAAVKKAESEAGATGEGEGKRFQVQIDNGLQAADSTAILRRSIELLDSVPTGGIDAAKLAATNFLGVTGADEAELSANVGKAVLGQLRSTFGSQFTENEGQRLASIEAGFGKSTEGNKRLLGQALKLVNRVAERGARAAESTGDKEAAQEIRDAMAFTTSPPGAGKAPAVGTVQGGYRFKGGDPSKQENWTKVQ